MQLGQQDCVNMGEHFQRT